MSNKETTHIQDHQSEESMEEIQVDPLIDQTNLSPNSMAEKILGNYLTQLRESKNISIKELSIDTKISESVLQNLEAEKFNELPRKIYLMGFLKTYCQYFKVNPNKALNLLEKVFQQNNPITDIEGRFENHDGPTVNSKSLIKLIVFIISIIIMSLLARKIFFNKKFEVINTEITTEKLDSSTPLAGSPSNMELTQETTEIKSEGKNLEEKDQITTNKVTLDVKTEKLEENNQPKNETSSEEGDQLPTEMVLKEFPAGFLKYLETPKSELEEFIPDNIFGPTEGSTEKIIISAKEAKTWIAYQKDDEEIKQLILKEGKLIVISGNEIRIVLGNSNLVRLVHNQKEVDIKSKTGIKSLVFPEAAATKFRLPLFYQNNDGQYVSSGKF